MNVNVMGHYYQNLKKNIAETKTSIARYTEYLLKEVTNFSKHQDRLHRVSDIKRFADTLNTLRASLVKDEATLKMLTEIKSEEV